MNKIIFLIKVTCITLFICSCNVIKGNITETKGNLVKCKGRWFKVEGTPPQVGSKVTFKPSRDSLKINSFIIKNN